MNGHIHHQRPASSCPLMFVCFCVLTRVTPEASGEECVTWAVAAQHPRLDEGGGDADVVKQTAVLTAGLQPRACDQHLHASLQHTNRPLIPHAVASVSRKGPPHYCKQASINSTCLESGKTKVYHSHCLYASHYFEILEEPLLQEGCGSSPQRCSLVCLTTTQLQLIIRSPQFSKCMAQCNYNNTDDIIFKFISYVLTTDCLLAASVWTGVILLFLREYRM